MSLIAWVDFTNPELMFDQQCFTLKDFIEGNEPIEVGRKVLAKDSWDNTCEGVIGSIHLEMVRVDLDIDTYKRVEDGS